MRRLLLLGLTVLVMMPACAAPVAESFAVLIFTRTAAYRHDSIPAGVAAIESLGERHGFRVEATEDPARFTARDLARFDAVVWLNTSGDVLDEVQQEAFQQYVRAGGGYVGIHGASDTEYGWPWYGQLVGAWFADHPQVQPGTVRVVDPGHPATTGLPPVWHRTDEWYNFRTDPRDRVHVLTTVDEASYEGGTMGEGHPISWCHAFDGGRSWYTAMGHTASSYAEPEFLAHLLGGIRFAALGDGACS